MTTKLRSPLLTFALLAGAAALPACGNDGEMGRYTLIDDMEGSGNVIRWLPPGGEMAGSWWTAVDCTEQERITPPPWAVDPNGWSYDLLPEPHETFPGITSTHATRLRTTSPLTGVWGASVGLNFLVGTRLDGVPPVHPGPPCWQPSSLDFDGGAVDLGAYSGVTFWAANVSGLRTLHVSVRDRNTDPHGGFCNAANPSSDEGCYNDFDATVSLTDAFARYTIDFAALVQNPNWGVRPDPSVLDLQHVYSLIFTVDFPGCVADPTGMCAGGESPPFSFDFRIDDVYLVNR